MIKFISHEFTAPYHHLDSIHLFKDRLRSLKHPLGHAKDYPKLFKSHEAISQLPKSQISNFDDSQYIGFILAKYKKSIVGQPLE